MKKAVLILIAGVIFVLASYAADTVSSANIVGYKTITVLSNQYNLISTAFDSTNNTIESTFTAMPTGTIILFWDTVNQQYKSISKTRGGWGENGTNVVERGSGVFIKLPDGINTMEITVSGDVPLDDTFTNCTAEGYTLMSYPYPSEVEFEMTALSTNSAIGDIISFWDNGWISYSKTRGGWADLGTNSLKIGQAFFYKTSATEKISEPRPYNLNESD